MELKMLPYSFKEVGAGLAGLVLAIAAILLPLKHKKFTHVCSVHLRVQQRIRRCFL